MWKNSRALDFRCVYVLDGDFADVHVEVKQGSGKYGRWAFASDEAGIRANQREIMNEHLEISQIDWVFIVLGIGRAPNGRGAFLVPWPAWKKIEAQLLASGQRSIRFDGGRQITAKDILKPYALEWANRVDSISGWSLAHQHPFYKFINDKFPTLENYSGETEYERLPLVGD